MNRALRAFARQLGMPLRRLGRDAPLWTGEAINATFVRSDCYLAHEIGHFVCAPQDRRRLPNYGLGREPVSFAPASRLVGTNAADDEESLASTVGAAIVAGFAPADLAETLERISFVREEDCRWRVARSARCWLQRAMQRGALGEVAIPVLRTPFVLVDFLTAQSEALLAPVMALAGERP